MNRCPACGKTYSDEARFCTRDGSKLVAVVEKGTRETVVGRTEQPSAETHGNLTGRVLDGRYRIERKVGEGGMSFVYLANDVATDEQYAIKVLSAALSSDANAMARLRREASLGMRLAHPNICHIIRLGETQDGLVYVVMPYVEGEMLSDRNNRLGHDPARRRRALCARHRGRAARRARAQDRAPRSQAREHDDLSESGRWRARRGDGLRSREGAARGRRAAEAHRDRHHPRHAGVHEPRAAARQAARSAHRRLLAGADDVRDADRQAAVHRDGRSRR